MAVETFGFIGDLVPTNPTELDPKSQGDDHIRGIKATLKNQFPNFTGVAVNSTEAQLEDPAYDPSTVAATATSVKAAITSLHTVPRTLSTTDAYTLVLADRGGFVLTNNTVSVPANVFNTGDVITVINSGSANVTLAQGSGLTLRLAGDTETGARTIGAYGVATIIFTGGQAVAYVTGAGVS